MVEAAGIPFLFWDLGATLAPLGYHAQQVLRARCVAWPAETQAHDRDWCDRVRSLAVGRHCGGKGCKMVGIIGRVPSSGVFGGTGGIFISTCCTVYSMTFRGILTDLGIVGFIRQFDLLCLDIV